MDHYPILDQSVPAPILPGGLSKAGAGTSISSQIATANAHLKDLPEKVFPEGEPAVTLPRFPGEDSGQSLAEFAQADLDAALQLLADRALYITGASGAAIALRRGEQNDMLCRASAGVNAPELGALLSMEYGLSGESVRTRQPLRCDDAERDPRVNHQVCRDLGISSVVVMPIVGDDRVLGVFELLSGKVRAFDERDLSALLRLSQMVEIAFRQSTAQTIQAFPPVDATALAREPENASPGSTALKVAAAETAAAPLAAPAMQQSVSLADEPTSPAPVPKKPIFWSASARSQATPSSAEDATASTAPPALRGLQKCQACGFPVSRGRTFCVECEEKQWRGQRLTKPHASPQKPDQSSLKKPENIGPQSAQETRIPEKVMQTTDVQSKTAPDTRPRNPQETFIPDSVSPSGSDRQVPALPKKLPHIIESPTAEAVVSAEPAESLPQPQLEAFTSSFSTSFLGSALPPESWLSANKYVVSTLLLVAAVLSAVVWFH
jgi:hypothetical protein